MLADIMELNKLEKDQLIQLAELFFQLLQNREVTVNVKDAPQPFSFPITYAYPGNTYVPVITPGVNNSGGVAGNQ